MLLLAFLNGNINYHSNLNYIFRSFNYKYNIILKLHQPTYLKYSTKREKIAFSMNIFMYWYIN